MGQIHFLDRLGFKLIDLLVKLTSPILLNLYNRHFSHASETAIRNVLRAILNCPRAL